ncbi:hypothetical protein JOB18_033568 [Solea senegalensis]|uniref:Uncharacterized protein n=1 Tax=Solea senegalensis TaxID=28829 RepID=A0AAV6QR10_SOLSE|nr:hypothetical protein JOB18_033568 [Solea senegalensis]
MPLHSHSVKEAWAQDRVQENEDSALALQLKLQVNLCGRKYEISVPQLTLEDTHWKKKMVYKQKNE